MLPQAFQDDFRKALCATCGAQYPVELSSPPKGCLICLDERQYVPATGQKWTSIGELLDDGVHTTLEPIDLDERIVRVMNSPGVGISQTPILLYTPTGVVMWDATGYISPSAIGVIRERFTPTTPFLGIAISHPHFFNAAATLFRALTERAHEGCVAPSARIFVSEVDKQWWTRTDAPGLEHVDFWAGDVKPISEGVTIVRCGGHFPGSCILHWDRSSKSAKGDQSGVVLCSDTIGIGMDRKATFMWSYPNFLPLPPGEVKKVVRAVRPYAFEHMLAAWPEMEILDGAKEVVVESARRFVRMEGWDVAQFDLS